MFFVQCFLVLLISINRNIVECKSGRCVLSAVLDVVLIETLWNVNCLFLLCFHRDRYRINRNIVECKYRNRHVASEDANCINRNIVECKF